jgi:hypothetical protein
MGGEKSLKKELWACCLDIEAARASKTVGIRLDLMDADSRWAMEDVNVFTPLFSVFLHQRRWRNQTQDSCRLT